MNRTSFSTLAIFAALLFGCTSEKKAPVQEKKPAPVAETKADPAPQPASTDTTAGNPGCFGDPKGGDPREVTAGATMLKGNGYSLAAAATPERSGKLVIGIVSDLKDKHDGWEARLKAYSKWFGEQGVEAVVINGGDFYYPDHMETVLMGYASTFKMPVYVISGNKEAPEWFQEIASKVSAKHANLINGNRVRTLTMNDVSLVSLPGYGRKMYTDPGACLFDDDQIATTTELLKAAPGSAKVLVSHQSPLQDGVLAVDFMGQPSLDEKDKKNVGDPRVTAMLKGTGTQLAIVGGIKEAGGRGTDLAGKAVEVDKMSPQLLINPGPADTSHWTMNDGSSSWGMVAVMRIDGGKASYGILRMPEHQPAK
ncbi:MAG TPA: hypothetical protein DEB46_07295 [Myxococcales bacterium]|nr:hypothetical protein [Myxococcales bacterium]